MIRNFTEKQGNEYVLLAAITGCAAFLRFFKLGEWSLWGDEIFSLGTRSDGFIESTSVSLIHWITSSLGTSEWSARAIPALIGIFSVPLLYFPVRRILGARVGLLAISLLAVSTWHIYWSQNARFYVLLLLFYTLALLTFYLGLEEDGPWWILFSLVLFGLATKERLLALFLLPVLGGYILCLLILPIERPAGLRWRNLALFFVPLILVALIFSLPYLQNISGWLSAFSRVNNEPVWLMAGTFYYIGLPVVVLAVFGALFFILKDNRPALLFSLGAVIPLLGIMAISLFHYAANRYIFVSLTSWIILAAMTLDALFHLLPGHTRILAAGILTLVVGVALSESFVYYQYQYGNRDRWKEAFEFVRENRREGDLVVVANTGVGDYYLGAGAIGFKQFDVQNLEGFTRAWFVEDLTVKALFPVQHTWMEENARLAANFDNYVSARIFTMRVYFYDKDRLAADLVQNTR